MGHLTTHSPDRGAAPAAVELPLRPLEGLARWTGWGLRQVVLGLVSMREVPEPTRGRLSDAATYFRRDRHRRPTIDVASYQLHISGVATPRSFSVGELAALPQEERVLVMECAGNGNHLMGSCGLMGQARWRGPSLAGLIEACGGPADSSHFVFRGLDSVPLVRGGYHYGLSLVELREAGALVALTMNGEALSTRHGAPARLVVPGIYSMSHVKWLGSVEGTTEAHDGFYNRRLFVNEERGPDGAWRTIEARWIGLKSALVRCEADPTAERSWLLSGWAWGGRRGISRVHITTDGGATWQPCAVTAPTEGFSDTPELDQHALAGAWTQFSFSWRDPPPGPHLLASRAVDSSGVLQDLERPEHIRGHYDQTHVKWRRVVVPS